MDCVRPELPPQNERKCSAFHRKSGLNSPPPILRPYPPGDSASRRLEGRETKDIATEFACSLPCCYPKNKLRSYLPPTAREMETQILWSGDEKKNLWPVKVLPRCCDTREEKTYLHTCSSLSLSLSLTSPSFCMHLTWEWEARPHETTSQVNIKWSCVLWGR